MYKYGAEIGAWFLKALQTLTPSTIIFFYPKDNCHFSWQSCAF